MMLHFAIMSIAGFSNQPHLRQRKQLSPNISVTVDILGIVRLINAPGDVVGPAIVVVSTVVVVTGCVVVCSVVVAIPVVVSATVVV